MGIHGTSVSVASLFIPFLVSNTVESVHRRIVSFPFQVFLSPCACRVPLCVI